MRAVAAELGVEAMSLYWHVPGKEALLDGVVERMLVEVAPEVEHRDDWRDELYGLRATPTRGVLLRHPNAIPLLAGRPLGRLRGRRARRGRRPLRTARGGRLRPRRRRSARRARSTGT